MTRLIEFLVGLLFGLGLLLSGMTDPGKVLGFLDLAGAWDPSLALVMGGAVALSFVGFALAKKRGTTLQGAPLLLPQSTQINRRLVIGSVMFGVGWGLAGFCPGPAWVTMAAGHTQAAVFVAAMVVGMVLFELAERYFPRRD